MAWDATFIDFIEGEREVKPVVKIVKHVWPTWGQGPTFTASTHPNFIESDLGIIEGSVVINGERLNTQTWTVSGGGGSFMTGSNPCGFLTRGHVLRVYLGFDGLDESDMEIISWWVVRDITAHGGVKLTNTTMRQGPWVIVCDPFFAAFQNRPSNDPNAVTLFYATTVGQGSGTTSGEQEAVTSSYTAGDATLQVTSVAGFATGDSGVGAVLVQEDGGATFYGTYNGTSGGNTFTGFSGGWLTNPTSDADVATGTVLEVPWLRNHPSYLFRQILASTGTGLNGGFDVYDVDWGLGLDDQYIDNVDAGLYYDESETADQWTLRIIPAVPITNALQWLISILAPGGFFPVITQGAFSLRCALDPEATDPDSGITIIDRDLDEGPDAITFSAFSPDSPVAYSQVRIKGYEPEPADPDALAHTVYSTPYAELPTLPAAYLWTVDYSNINTGLLYDSDNDALTASLNLLRDRLSPWYQNIPERYTIRAVGYRLYQLALGSLVTLTTGTNSLGLMARLTERNGEPPRDRRAVVVGWAPNLLTGKITLDLAVMPETSTEIPT